MEFVESKKPEKYSALLARSIKLYRLGFNKVIAISLLLSILAFLPRILDFFKSRNFFNVTPWVHSNAWFWVIDFICLILFILILERFELVIERKKDKLKKDFILSLKKLPLAIIASFVETIIISVILLAFYALFVILHNHGFFNPKNLVQTVLVMLPFFVQVLFFVYLIVALMFYIPLIVTENFGVFSSLQASFSLVWNNWWATLLFQVTPWVIYSLVISCLQFGAKINVHLLYAPQDNTTFFAMLVHILIFAMYIPWVATCMLSQLHDLELRHQLRIIPKSTARKKKLAAKKSAKSAKKS